MSTVKVNGGRALDASCETSGDDLSGRVRSRGSSSTAGKSSVDHVDGTCLEANGGLSLDDRRERHHHQNPWQKAVSGVRSVFRHLTVAAASPSLLRRRRRSLDEGEDASIESRPQGGHQATRSSSESRLSMGQQQRSPRSHLLPRMTLPDGRHPGAVGIHNHGNSCFLNAVIQCLSNTDLLTEYLLGDETKDAIARSGQNCAVTRRLVALVESLWTGSYESDVSCLFKQVVGERAEQYSGTTQNDAQEFLLWLLDKVNEELHCVSSKVDNEVQSKVIQGRNNNGSIIFDLFEAKYRSTLTCPSCQRESNTYDPFLSVSLPIQLKSRLPVYVTVASMEPRYHQVLYGLMMNTGDKVAQLRRVLSRKTGIKEKQLLLTQIYEGKFQSTLHDTDLLVDLDTLDFLYAIELYDDSGSSGNTSDSEYSGNETVCIVAMNRVRDGARHSSRFGGPFVVNVSRESTTLQLRGALLRGMQFMVPEGNMEQVIVESQFFMRLMSDVSKSVYLCDTDELPLYAVSVDHVLTICSESVPPHIKLVLEWKYADYKRMLVNTHPSVRQDLSYEQIKASMHQKNAVDLQDCFSAFTQQEQLGDDDSWLCPNCHKHQRGTMKSLNLCSLPDVMVIHLKRFRQDGKNRSKLNTRINFPVTGLDMTYHLTKDCSPSDSQPNVIRPDDYIYDLYGVCNHDGAMSQGHYKAICRNALNGQWYVYDDVKVSPIREDRIVSRTAYLLFYKRRKAKSRCHTQLDERISQLLGFHDIKSLEPDSVDTSRSVSPNNNNNNTVQSARSVNSPNHFNGFNASAKQHASSSSAPFSRTSNSFHASLQKPLPRRTPNSQWTVNRHLNGDASFVGQSTMTRSITQPLQQKPSLPTNGNKMMNGRVKERSSDDIDLSSTASVFNDSAVSEAVARPTSLIKPKPMFRKAPTDDSNRCSAAADAIVPEITQKQLNAWQLKAGKFVQESAV